MLLTGSDPQSAQGYISGTLRGHSTGFESSHYWQYDLYLTRFPEAITPTSASETTYWNAMNNFQTRWQVAVDVLIIPSKCKTGKLTSFASVSHKHRIPSQGLIFQY